MKYILQINQVKAIELGIKNTTEAIILDLLSVAPTWAEPIIINDTVYYWTARQKIKVELKLLDLKDDTIYRYLKELDNLGLIEYRKHHKKDCIRITKKGKSYISSTMSEKNPNYYVGKKSESTISENNPTYNIPYSKEEKEEYSKSIKSFIQSTLHETTLFEVFSIEFYDFIYPKNKKSNQQKIWYGNTVKNQILKQDKLTLNNIENFLEYQAMQNFRGNNYE